MVTTAAAIATAAHVPASFITPVSTGRGVNISRNKPVREAVERWKALKAVEAAGEAAKKERQQIEKAVMRPILKPGDYFIVNAQKVLTLGLPVDNSHIDKGKLLELSPELYTLTLVHTPYTTFKAL